MTLHNVFSGDFPDGIETFDDGTGIRVANAFHLTEGTGWCFGLKFWLPENAGMSPNLVFGAWQDQTLAADPVAIGSISSPVVGWNTALFSTPVEMVTGFPLWLGYEVPVGGSTKYLAYFPETGDALISGTYPALRLSEAGHPNFGRSIFRYDYGAYGSQGRHALWGVDIIFSDAPPAEPEPIEEGPGQIVVRATVSGSLSKSVSQNTLISFRARVSGTVVNSTPGETPDSITITNWSAFPVVNKAGLQIWGS